MRSRALSCWLMHGHVMAEKSSENHNSSVRFIWEKGKPTPRYASSFPGRLAFDVATLIQQLPGSIVDVCEPRRTQEGATEPARHHHNHVACLHNLQQLQQPRPSRRLPVVIEILRVGPETLICLPFPSMQRRDAVTHNDRALPACISWTDKLYTIP